jgi:nickel/cobalt transporter (NicO) family protein
MLHMGLAYAYGAVHAAGPGKAVATAYVLSHNVLILRGLLFGLFIAMIHGMSGVVGVVGLRYVIERSVSQTLADAITITQLVSFGLIAVLGLALVVQYGHALFFARAPVRNTSPQASGKLLLPWAAPLDWCPARRWSW